LNVDLRDGECSWKKRAVYDLGRYDAGTEEGSECVLLSCVEIVPGSDMTQLCNRFRLDNYPTCPAEPIGPIVDAEIGVIGKVVFTRIDGEY
jgi:hypothetical protein